MKMDEKITSLEAFKESKYYRAALCNPDERHAHHFRIGSINVLVPAVMSSRDHNVWEVSGAHHVDQYYPLHMWWFVREANRYLANREMYGSILANLWSDGYHAVWCPRPHMADLTKVEFFPDAAAAAAERPIVTSMAKFLRRSSPIYTDEYIRDVDAAYRASLSNEIEILSGPMVYREVYQNSVHSCMAYDFAAKDLNEGHHPVDAYDMPGMGIAVGRDGSGKINARCIVYTNGDDKRMIRVYGDGSLAARLKRNGYVYRSLSGLKLKALPVKHNTNKDGKVYAQGYVLPYLDGVEGKHNAETAARYVIKFDDEDALTVVSDRAGQQMQEAARTKGIVNAENYVYTTGNAEGFSNSGLVAISRSLAVYVCPVTGATIDLLTQILGSNIEIWFNGAIHLVMSNDAISARFQWMYRLVKPAGMGVSQVYYEEKPAVFDSMDGYKYVDNDEGRAHAGFIKLSAIYYPGEQGWIQGRTRYSSRTPNVVRLDDGSWIKREDAVEILTNLDGVAGTAESYNPIVAHVHKSTITEKLKRVHSRKVGVPIYVDDKVYTVKTDSGRTVVPGFHSVVRLFDRDVWAFERNVEERHLFGMGYYALRSEQSTPAVGGKLWESAKKNIVSHFTYYDQFMTRRQLNWENFLWGFLRGQDAVTFDHRRGLRRGSSVYMDGARMSDDMVHVKAILQNPAFPAKDKAYIRAFVAMYAEIREMYIDWYNVWREGYTPRGYDAPAPDVFVRPVRVLDLTLPDDVNTPATTAESVPAETNAAMAEASPFAAAYELPVDEPVEGDVQIEWVPETTTVY